MLEAQQLLESEVNSTNTGGPAFPVPANAFNDMEGMTLRDYFAAKAMTLMPDSWDWSHEKARERSARIAYEMADAMLKARVA